MGFWRTLFGLDLVDPTDGEGVSFSVDVDSIDPAVFGLESYASSTAPAPRIDRRSAIQVPAVKRSRDMIAGPLGGLPLDLIGPDKAPAASVLFEQPEKHVPRSVTMTRLYEDLLFEEVAWWEITEFGWHTYPVHVKRHAPRTVDDSRLKDEGKVYVKGRHIPNDHLIRFESPNDGLLKAGARAIRTCLQLDAAAANQSDGIPALDYFELRDPEDDPPEDDEITEFLVKWRDYRRARSTGFIPPEYKYVSEGRTSRDLQLSEARQHAVLEIARVAGVDPEDLGVSTTSRTYQNGEQRRLDLLDFTLGAYVDAVQDRLSMGDVTPRGYIARVRLDKFLRSDTKSRYEAYKLGLEVGALGQDEIRPLEDKPQLRDDQKPDPAPAAVPAAPQPLALPPGASAMSQLMPAAAFDFQPLDRITFATAVEEAAIRLDAPMAGAAFEVDREQRVIRGMIVPYGVPARSKGMWWQFAKGTLKFSDVTRVKLLIQHVFADAVGYAFELDDRDDGMYGAFKVARGKKGDKALRLAEDKVLDGFSIGLADGGRYQQRRLQDGRVVNFAVEAPLQETSLTPAPSFDDSRVQSVAASATPEGNTMEPCPTCGHVHAAGVTDCLPEHVAAFQAEQAGPDFSALGTAITDLTAALTNPQGIAPREGSPGSETFQVTDEPLPYRFDGTPNGHGHTFLEDAQLAFRQGDGEARQRIEEFMDAAFAVTVSGTSALNPTQNRPELYVPNLQYTTPLWDLVSQGSITDKTPFTIPKFSAAAGLVGAHTEGTEPTPGSFSATSQTITPSPMSGKIEINREVWDQGGSPQADQIIWQEMLNGWYEAREAAIATLLNGLSLTEVNLASAVDEALVDALTGILVDLQFVRGGNRYTSFAADGLLFKAAVQAGDADGRKLLPVIGPANAQGQVGGGFDRVAIGNLAMRAAWALGATNASNSYLFVPSSVWAWTSAPKKFVFEYQVKSVDMAIWGYSATACLRTTDVKRLDYTTADV